MGKITERLTELSRRCGDLSPIAGDVRQVLVQGNRERALAGQDAQGHSFAPLAASTIDGRKGSGPALAPQGASSRIVIGLVVAVLAGVGRLSFSLSWPGLPWIGYHRTGTKRMPQRDPFGIRVQDLDQIRGIVRNHITR